MVKHKLTAFCVTNSLSQGLSAGLRGWICCQLAGQLIWKELTLVYSLTSSCPVIGWPGRSSVIAVEPTFSFGLDWETNRAGGPTKVRGSKSPNLDNRVNMLAVQRKYCWPGTGNKTSYVFACLVSLKEECFIFAIVRCKGGNTRSDSNWEVFLINVFILYKIQKI